MSFTNSLKSYAQLAPIGPVCGSLSARALVDEAHEPSLPSLPTAMPSAGYSAVVVEGVMMGASETAMAKLGLQNASGSAITR